MSFIGKLVGYILYFVNELVNSEEFQSFVVRSDSFIKYSLKVVKSISEEVIVEVKSTSDTTIIFVSLLVLAATILTFRSIFWRKPRTLEDKIKQLQKCEEDIRVLINEKNCNPLMLRLAWSDACTYDRTIRKWPACGGANGYVRFEEIYNNPVNTGLSKAIALLSPIKAKYTYRSSSKSGGDALSEVVGERSISWADIIQMAGAIAVQHAGGPRVPILYGRIDAPYSVQLVKQMKPELLMPCANAPYSDGTGSAEVHVRNVFYNRMGFTNQEIVALCGGHTIGRGFQDRTGVTDHSSGDQGATDYTRQTCIVRADGQEGVGMPGGCSWTKNWLTFDNSYYTILHTTQSKRRSSASRSIASSSRDKLNEHDSSFSTPHAVNDNATPSGCLKQNQNPNTNPKWDAEHSVDTSQLLWTSADKAVSESPEFSSYFRQYANDTHVWFKEYVSAHVKFSNLGVKFLPPGGIDIHNEATSQ